MSAGPQVVLDACVLATFSLCDTLLRLAETPSLYAPKWSAEIMAETVRTLDARLGWPAQLTSYFQSELLSHFGDAWVTGYEPLITRMTNDEKDRHVVATAVSCGASIIVTFNLRHFRKEHLDPWKVIALHPDSFLRALYQQEPAVVRAKLRMQASDRKRTLPELLTILAATVPAFVEQIQSSPEA
jgi:predicted nucleic acid-binding protein